jgi:hypothetical protein
LSDNTFILITGRTIKQGMASVSGKKSNNYKKETSYVEVSKNVLERMNIEEGEEHTWRNDSESDAELIITFAPAGIEHMFRELEINKANIKVIGQKYGADFQIG